MRSYGVIYDSLQHPYLSPASTPAGTVWLDLPEAPLVARLSWRLRHVNYPAVYMPVELPGSSSIRPALSLASNGLILVGAAGILLTMLPVVAMEVKYAYLSNLTNSPNLTNSSALPTPPPGPANEEEAFSVHIPKIDAHSKVVPNIDAGDPTEYSRALAEGVAHAKGTGLPGVNSQINRTIYLFAHSTSSPSLVAKYNAQFYLLSKMEVGDEVEVTFWAQPYRYRVVEKKVTSPKDTSYLERQTEKEILVLATCTPAGTTINRLLVIAERI